MIPHEKTNACIVLRIARNDVRRIVDGPVIDDDDLDLTMRLGGNGLECAANEARGIQGRNDDGDELLLVTSDQWSPDHDLYDTPSAASDQAAAMNALDIEYEDIAVF